MSYGTTHTSTIPTVSVTTGPTYATQINNALLEIRATLDAKVTPAGIDLDDDLSFLSGGTYSAAVDVGRVNFENKSGAISAASFPNALFVSSGELYYNDDASQQIQVTSGGALNISTTGAITGAGYGSGGVEVNWNTANTEYRMKSGSGADDYAHVKMNDLLLNDGSGNFIRFAAPAIAADYTVTWPTGVPGSTLPVLMNSSGVLSTSGTLANLVTFTTSGAGTVGTTLGVTGLATLSGGASVTGTVVATSTVAGSDLLISGTRTKSVPVFAFVPDPQATEWEVGTTVGYAFTSAGIGATDTLTYGFVVDVGDRFAGAITLRIKSSTAETLTATFRKESADGTVVDITAATSGTGSAVDATLSLSFTAFTVGSSEQYYLDISPSGHNADLRVYRMAYTWNRPA